MRLTHLSLVGLSLAAIVSLGCGSDNKTPGNTGADAGNTAGTTGNAGTGNGGTSNGGTGHGGTSNAGTANGGADGGVVVGDASVSGDGSVVGDGSVTGDGGGLGDGGPGADAGDGGGCPASQPATLSNCNLPAPVDCLYGDGGTTTCHCAGAGWICI